MFRFLTYFMFKLMEMISLGAYADISVVTNTGVTNGGTLFTEEQRIVYSKEIAFKALPILRFSQFASYKEELGTEPGGSISMLTYNSLKLGGRLEENKNMTTQALSGSNELIKVLEYGNAVSMTELTVRTAFDDVMESATTLLGRDYAQVLDATLRDTALSGTNRVFAAKADGTANADRVSIDAGSAMKVSTIKDALEILSTGNAPKVNGAFWVCMVHPHQSRTLRDDPAWVNASNYAQPENLLTGEIGRIDDVVFIETTMMSNGAAPEVDPSHNADLVTGFNGNLTNIYQSVIFGENYYGLAVALPVEIRDNGVEDFGRKRSLAWYSIMGTGVLNDSYGVVIETA